MSPTFLLVNIISLVLSTAEVSFPLNGSFIPITNAQGFDLCTKLNLAGCGITTINDFIRQFINSQVQNAGYNYSLPLDPCEFSTINMTWILTLIDTAILNYVSADQVLNSVPCEIYIQMPSDFLSTRDLSAIISDSYWFGANGECVYNASNIVDCSDPNRTTANYTTYHGLECFYPFVPSKYETPFKQLYDAGLTHCGVSCHYIPYLGDIKKLDDFNYASSMIALIFGIAFFINTSIEFYKAYKGSHKFADLPLTFDIPVIIAIWMMILAIILAIPSWVGKEYFSCEIGTEAQVIIPSRKTNIRCYISGQFTLLAINSIYLYSSLLAFAIWRSLANPFRPLFKIHKMWYHVVVYVIIIGMYIGALSEDIFSANSMTGMCGPNVIGDWGRRYLLVPLSAYMATFIIFTVLGLYKLWFHLHYRVQLSDAERAIVHLAIRLVIYSLFVAASLACFIYVAARFSESGDEWKKDLQNHIECYTDNAFLGKTEECVMELSIEDGVYWMQGLVLLLVSSASFVLSCTNQRHNDYLKMKDFTKKQIEKIASTSKMVSSVVEAPQSVSMTSKHTLANPESTRDTTKDENAIIAVISSESEQESNMNSIVAMGTDI